MTSVQRQCGFTLTELAIVMLKRGVATGHEIVARWDDGECAARVRDLPFN